MSRQDYRQFVPAPGTSRIAGATPREHAAARLKAPRAQELFATWDRLAAEPFRGVTTDGMLRPGLFSLEPANAPTATMAEAAGLLLARLPADVRQRMVHPVTSPLWQMWQNTEILVEKHGLRLDETTHEVRECVLRVLAASLSANGFETTRGVMKLNQFLGDLVGGPAVLGEWAYTFVLFGTPSTANPWGWQLFGHHLSLNCLVIGGQMVLSPTFMGAEPSHCDEGSAAGIHLFQDEERLGLEMMRSLSAEQQRVALVSPSMNGGDHPPGRWHFADHFHLGGAHQDNKIVPFEGLRCDAMSVRQRRDLMDLVAAYVEPLPPGPFAARLTEVERHLAETHFCWIGGHDETSPFYYRIQSPVIFIEFDHHSGVFLTNQEPQRFHVHTVVRTPNGNDYGIDVLRQHYAHTHHHGAAPG